MPFTLSHPAVVLPLGGRGRGGVTLALPALVAGSMAPDLPYYSPLTGAVRGWTHSAAGAFTIDALFAVLLLGVGVFVAGPLAALLTGRWAALVGGWTARAWPRRRSVLDVGAWYAALVVGALTHVGWDAFTHPDGQVVTRLHLFDDVVAGQPVYQLLQWGSSILGGAVVLVALRNRLRAGPARGDTADAHRQAWFVLASAAFCCAVAGAVLKGATGRTAWSAFDLLTGFVAGAVAAVLGYAAVDRLRTVSRRPRRRAGRAMSPAARPESRTRG